ncbi:MAG: GNAT family N-acetyltransferase [Neisseriaceae bacterium]|jgi:RimJ/RimL family protein N-acetyltransferase
MYETKRLILRNWLDSDLNKLYKINQDPIVMEFFPHLYSMDKTLEQIKSFKEHYQKHGHTFFACELKDTQEFIGSVGLFTIDNNLPFAPNIEIGWRTAKEYWNKGYATEAANECLKIGFEEFNLQEIVSYTAKINHRSEHIMQKIGMFRDMNGDFDNPKIEPTHILCPHILYRITKKDWVG